MGPSIEAGAAVNIFCLATCALLRTVSLTHCHLCDDRHGYRANAHGRCGWGETVNRSRYFFDRAGAGILYRYVHKLDSQSQIEEKESCDSYSNHFVLAAQIIRHVIVHVLCEFE